MAKSVPSGLHKLKTLIGESIFDLSKELHRLREQLEAMDRDYAAYIAKQPRNQRIANTTLAIIAVALLCVAIWIIERSIAVSGDRLSWASGAGLLLVVAGAGMILIAGFVIDSLPAKKRTQLAQRRSDFERQVRQYAVAITERLRAVTAKRGEVGRTAWLGASARLFYCPSYTALLDFVTEEMMLLNTVDCRDVRLSYKELERRSVLVGSIHSAVGRSITGAAIGALVFGEVGIIAGSVIGSAAKRKDSMETIEKKIGKHVVDLFTRLQEVPVVTVEFDDDKLAKEFYGVMAAAVPRPINRTENT